MKDNKEQKMRVTQSFSSEAGMGLPQSRGISYKGGSGYIPFSDPTAKYGTENQYPQQLANLAFNAPTHNAAIKTKQFMIEGQGFDLSLLSPGLVSIFESINEYQETANDILLKVSWDVSIFGGFALKVCWNNAGKIVEVEHIPFTDVRCGKPNEDGGIEYFKISNNWDRSLTGNQEKCYDLPRFNPDYFANGVEVESEYGIPTPTEDQVDNSEQLIYYWAYKPFATNGMRYYPLPDYVGALDQIRTEVKIGVSNMSKIDNGMGGKYLVQFPYLPQSTEEQQEIDNNFKYNFTGAANDGTVITTYHSTPEDLPTITKLDSLDADTYIELEKSTKQNIITAHRVPAILVEYNFGGGFNNRAEEMAVAFNQFQQTSIKSYQIGVIRTFKTISKWMGFPDEPISIIPFSLIDSTTVQGNTSLTSN